jgi:hypothetical protein
MNAATEAEYDPIYWMWLKTFLPASIKQISLNP